MTSRIDRAGIAFTDTALPKLVRDPLIVGGSTFRVDFLNSYSNPNADGALAHGAVFRNLVDGGVDATYNLAGGTAMSNAAGKLGLICPGYTGGSANKIDFPLGALDLRRVDGHHDSVWHCWLNRDVGDSLLGQEWLGDRIGDTSPVWGATATGRAVYQTSDTGLPYHLVRSGGAGYSTAASSSVSGAAHLLSVGIVGTTESLYLDGVLVGTITMASALGLPARRSHGALTFSGQPSAGETLTVNGNVITLVASGATGAQVNIGANQAATMAAIAAYINANSTALNAEAIVVSSTVLAVLVKLGSSALLTLAEGLSNVALGAPIAAKNLSLWSNFKGRHYCWAEEDLTATGRTLAASVAAEYAGYRPRLVAAGLAAP